MGLDSFIEKINNKILILDDDLVLSKIFELTLREYDFDVFQNPNDAIKHIKNYSLAFIDYILPVMNGFEFYKKAIDINKNLDFIFMTGSDIYTDHFINLKSEKNIKTIIQKPFSIETIKDLAHHYSTERNIYN